MGFETHVDSIIHEADSNLEGWYFWENGLNVMDYMTGKRIVDILNDSEEIFALAVFNEKTLQIEFHDGDQDT